jgi:hypothetical protein
MGLSKSDMVHNLTNHPPASSEIATKLDNTTFFMIEISEWILDNVPEGREQSVCLTKLEELSMWAKAGIARNQDE